MASTGKVRQVRTVRNGVLLSCLLSRLAFRVSATKHPAGRSSPLPGCISSPLDDIRQSGAPYRCATCSAGATPQRGGVSCWRIYGAQLRCFLRLRSCTILARFARCPRGHFPVLAGLDAPPACSSLPYGLPAAPLQRTHPLRGYILGAPGALRSRAPPKHLRAPLISRCASHIEKSGNPGTSTALSSATPHSLASLRVAGGVNP